MSYPLNPNARRRAGLIGAASWLTVVAVVLLAGTDVIIQFAGQINWALSGTIVGYFTIISFLIGYAGETRDQYKEHCPDERQRNMYYSKQVRRAECVFVFSIGHLCLFMLIASLNLRDMSRFSYTSILLWTGLLVLAIALTDYVISRREDSHPKEAERY